jgi:hypothetical protein
MFLANKNKVNSIFIIKLYQCLKLFKRQIFFIFKSHVICNLYNYNIINKYFDK